MRGGNERHIDGDEVDEGSELFASEVAGVGLFEQVYALILSERESDLAVARVHRKDAGGSALKKAVSEAPGGSAHVEANFSRDIDLPMVKGALEFESAATDVTKVFAKEPDVRSRVDSSSGFLYPLFVHENFACEDESLCAFARRSKATLHQQFVESNLQSFLQKCQYAIRVAHFSVCNQCKL